MRFGLGGWRPSRASRGLTALVSGTGVAQGIAFLTVLAVGRLYDPDAFGAFALIVSVATVLVPLSTLKIEVAIIPADSDWDAFCLARGAIRLVLLCASFLLVLGPVLTGLGALGWLSSGPGYWYLVPALLTVYGLFAVLSQVALRQRQYGMVAWRGVAQNAITGVAQVVGSLATRAAVGLAVGELLGRIGGVLMLLPSLISYHRRFGGAGKSDYRGLWTRYGGVVRNFLPASFMDMLSVSIFVLFAGAWFGTEVAGYVGMTQRVLALPIALVGASLGQVLLAEISHAARRGVGGEQRLLRRSVLLLVAVAVVAAGTILVLGPWIFSTILGEQWYEAGVLARIMAVPLAVGIVWNPMSSLFVAYRRWRAFLIVGSVRLLATAGTGWTLHQMGASYMLVIGGMSFAAAAVQVAGLIKIRRMIRTELPAGSAALG